MKYRWETFLEEYQKIHDLSYITPMELLNAYDDWLKRNKYLKEE